MNYNPQDIEKKWQKQWREHPVGQTRPIGDGKKYYCLDMFPYPSGSGLHVGHWRGYVLSDIYARIKWLQGCNVLHPMGWDAFGLPAENDAIKKGIHPKTSTAKNISNFKRQMEAITGLYDWTKEVNTTDPDYYKWTQWIFIQMYKAGLAYQDQRPVNWCPSCLTGLANEEVVDDACERCGSKIEQKNIKQWVLRITEYAEKLLTGLDTLDWPEKVKTMQRNWIGKSEGLDIFFTATDVNGDALSIPVFTTTPETIFGVTFLAVAPDHELVDSLVIPERKHEVEAFLKRIQHHSVAERGDQEKMGVFTGSYAINPVNKEKVPVYLANYVLKEFGTGVVFGVPAHDERDFEFAKKYNLLIKVVVESPYEHFNATGELIEPYIHDGILINSGPFNGWQAHKDRFGRVSDYLIEYGFAEIKVSYRLRDWIFSRQRYWGEPIPLIHCPQDGIVPVPENQLPVALPDVEQYQPTGTGESPLADIAEWVNTTCPVCGGPAKRETNTMPQWAGSCWYFLRYPQPDLETKPFTKEAMEYWLPVDLYVGGIEHAILHLLYARFYVKVLYDLGFLPFNEPFLQLFNQGMINKYSETTGFVEKMSKSKGNVVNPDDIVEKYGSDALRMYMLFMGPPELDCEWQDSGLEGIKRFLNKFWNYITDPATLLSENEQEERIVTKRFHKFLKDFQERVDHFKPNTAISAFMEWLNDAHSQKMRLSKTTAQQAVVALSCMAPCMAAELLEQLFGTTLQDSTWPVFDPRLAQQEEATIAIAINGKTRTDIIVSHNADQATVEPLAQKAAAKWLEDKQIIKVIYVKNRMINFVVK